MDKTYTITLADGTKLEGLGLNGNNFVSAIPVASEMFVGNCSPMVISDGEVDEVHEHAELVQITEHGGEYWIVFRDLSAQEIKEMRLRSDVDYLAMMTETDLEEV